MTYFRLNCDVYLTSGKVGGALYDVGRGRLRPLSAEETQSLARLEGGVSIEEESGNSGGNVGVLLENLCTEEFGGVRESYCYVEPYVHASNSRTPGFFEPPLVIRAAYVQLSDSCLENCPDCGSGFRPVWQGCNGCERWPAVPVGSRWSEPDLAEFVADLGTLDVRTVFFAGGDPIQEVELLHCALLALRRTSPATSTVVSTYGAAIQDRVLGILHECGTKLNLVWNGPIEGVSRSFGAFAKTTDACRANGVAFYITVNVNCAVENPDLAKRAVETLGASRVLTSEPIRRDGSGDVLPLGSVAVRGPRRFKPITAKDVALRRERNTCLHGVVAIAADGTIRPCPMIPTIIGSARSHGLRGVFAARLHESHWLRTKDGVHDCRMCEFRYACVDCAAVDMKRGEIKGLSCAVCGYDPTTGTWMEHQGEQCGWIGQDG